MKNGQHRNIVHMSQFERPRGASSSSSTSLLHDSRDLAATQLSKALSDMMTKAADDLFDLAEGAAGFEMRNLYMEAMSLARDKRDCVESAFRKQFVQLFTREARKDKNASSTTLSLSVSEFSLVDPDALEESLASDNIANNIHGTCAEELFGIEKRVGVLLNDPELTNRNNPLGPEVIAEAFMEALKDWDCPVKVKLMLVMQFNKHMPSPIKSIYQEINQHLVEKGVLPKIRLGMKKRAQSTTPAFNMPSADGASDGGALESGGQGLFATLQQLMRLGGTAGNYVAGGIPDSGALAQGNVAPINSSVMNVLNQLQHGQMDGLVAGATFDVSTLTGGRTNVLREIKSTSVASSLGHVDAMTLDIVAMLFDYILDDRNIPDAIKALIGRLQIPVLKVAMLDKSFFSQKSHPARQFLDTLADASIGWNDEEGHQSGLYKKIDNLVQRVLNEFDDKVGIFTDVQEELAQFLAEERKRATELTGRSAQVIHHKEQTEIAKVMAHDEIRRRIQSQPLPDGIRAFLSGCWESTLTAAYTQAGEDSEHWTVALETMDDLVWSVTPKKVPEERKKLVSLLPGLLKRLQDGMELAAMPAAERDQFFAMLVKCHADAVKSGLQSAADEAANAAAAMVASDSLPDPVLDLPVLNDEVSTDFEEIPIPAVPLEADSSLMEELSSPSEESRLEMEDITVDDVRWETGLEAEGDDYDAMVSRLKRHTWIEFTQEDGTASRAKLAWISPLKGLYLFTNRLGERAVSITPSGLAAKFRNGQAVIIDDVALVDRAVSSLMERLKQTNSLPA